MTRRYKAISLFTGAGGMDIGFQRAGFEIIWANELMPHAAATYEKNHQHGVMHQGDLKGLLHTLPRKGDVFCVFGGPPCQGFSVAGKMQLDDERSQLVFTFMEVVERSYPAVFVMENVKALAQLEKFSHVRQQLMLKAHRLNYDANFFVLNAKDFGVPQSRERVFFVGFRRDLNVSFRQDYLETHKSQPPTLREIFTRIGPSNTQANPLSCKAKITLASKPIMRKSPYAGMLFNGAGRPLNTDGVSCTLPASMGGNKTPIVDEAHVFKGRPSWIESYHRKLINGAQPMQPESVPTYLRRLTIREAAAIQTFPENYEFSGPISSQYTQIGNAVPCGLAYAVAAAVIDAVEDKPSAKVAGQKQLSLVV